MICERNKALKNSYDDNWYHKFNSCLSVQQIEMDFRSNLDSIRYGFNTICNIVINSLLDFAQSHVNKVSILKENICQYGFVDFDEIDEKCNIGMFGILKFIPYMFSGDHNSYRPINCQHRRAIRASMMKMAKVFASHVLFVSDDDYWNHLLLIALGVYSFYFIDFKAMMTRTKDELANKETDHQLYMRMRSRISEYLQRFVISNIEPSLKSLNLSEKTKYSQISGGILAVSYGFIGDFQKYLQYTSNLLDIVVNHNFWSNSVIFHMYQILHCIFMINNLGQQSHKHGQHTNVGVCYSKIVWSFIDLVDAVNLYSNPKSQKPCYSYINF